MISSISSEESPDDRFERKVRFEPGCYTGRSTGLGQRRFCCDDFMEETITVHEIERIFDIDFEKVTRMTSCTLLSMKIIVDVI